MNWANRMVLNANEISKIAKEIKQHIFFFKYANGKHSFYFALIFYSNEIIHVRLQRLFWSEKKQLVSNKCIIVF